MSDNDDSFSFWIKVVFAAIIIGWLFITFGSAVTELLSGVGGNFGPGG